MNATFFNPALKFYLLIIDGIIFSLIFFGFKFDPSFGASVLNVADPVIAITLVFFLMNSYVLGCYDFINQRLLSMFVFQLASVVSTSVFYIVSTFLLQLLNLGTKISIAGLYTILISGVLNILVRLFYRYIFRRISAKKGVVFLVDDVVRTRFQEELKKNTYTGRFQFVSANDSDVEDQISKIGNRLLVIGLDIHSLTLKTQQLLLNQRLAGLRILEFSDFYENAMGKVPLYYLDNRWFVLASGFGALGSRLSLRVKRICDLALSLCLLVFSLPILMLTAVVIKIDSPGPILYKQRRVGLRGKEFVIYKFRSMRTDAESDGPKWAQTNDSRVTGIGSFLRKSRIDELPQLLNVIKGEMSFIGPRPERPEFVVDLENEIPFYGYRHAALPGLTGWAQVCYRYGASVDDAREKLKYDLYYIKNQNLLLDLRIVLKTIRIVLGLRGT